MNSLIRMASKILLSLAEKYNLRKNYDYIISLYNNVSSEDKIAGYYTISPRGAIPIDMIRVYRWQNAVPEWNTLVQH